MNLKRDENGIAHVIGLSGGKDSTALALALHDREPRPYNYMYTPTGNELPEMEIHMLKLQSMLGTEIIRLTNGTLESVIHAEQMIPNFRARWCTRILKLVPAGRFYEAHAPVIAYIGLRDDEDEREGTRPGGDSAAIKADVAQDFPFQRWGWGIDEVLACLDYHKVTVPERTDCGWCFWQKLGEWYNLWLYHPEIYDQAIAIERLYGHTFRSDGRDTWPAALVDLRARFEAGDVPERSLNMMAKRKGMCRACSL